MDIETCIIHFGNYIQERCYRPCIILLQSPTRICYRIVIIINVSLGLFDLFTVYTRIFEGVVIIPYPYEYCFIANYSRFLLLH